MFSNFVWKHLSNIWLSNRTSFWMTSKIISHSLTFQFSWTLFQRICSVYYWNKFAFFSNQFKALYVSNTLCIVLITISKTIWKGSTENYVISSENETLENKSLLHIKSNNSHLFLKNIIIKLIYGVFILRDYYTIVVPVILFSYL